nr:hypothetical protein [Tanacetum cinerariifolium]
MRYVDTKPNKEQLRKCIKEVPFILIELVTPSVLAEGVNPGQPQVVKEETYINITPENKKLIDAEAESIHMILNGIGDNINSTMDACSSAKEIWEAIERLQQGESLNKENVKTKLFWNLEREYGYVSKKNDIQTSQFRNQRTKTVIENREAKEWLRDTDEEPVKQELEAHYMHMEKIQKTKVKNDSLIVQLNKKSIENTDLKARLQEKTDVNAELCNLLNKMKGKSVDTKFKKPSVGRQPNAFKLQKPSVMGKPSPFSNSLERQFF